MRVEKRDGKIEDFNIVKIRNVIRSAYVEVGEKFDEAAVRAVQLWLPKREKIHVEEIQDVVERVLMKYNERAAKAFILYREQHKKLRDVSALFNISLIDEYLERKDWRVQENANIGYSLQGVNMYITEKIASSYWLQKLYASDVSRAHIDGDFHIHDLGALCPYCVGWDLEDLLMTGVKSTPTKIWSKPAKHFGTALNHICNFLFTLTCEAAGAQAVSSIDTYLAPFIWKDELDEKEVEQNVQQFLFNMATETKIGNQSPFTNITLDLKVPKHMEEQAAIIGGRLTEHSYGDFQYQMDLFNDALTKVYAEGDAIGKPFTFPVPTYNITKDFDWDNNEGLWEMTSKYGTPYFANFINSDMDPTDVRSMCCRLRMDTSELKKRGGGLFGANPLTGAIGVVTLNMPRIGIVAKSDDEYLDRLNVLMELAKRSLITKRKVIERMTEKGLYPYSQFYLRNVKAHTRNFWSNHFSTIGLVGMNESLEYFLGKNIGEADGINFTLKVLDFMRNKLTEFQKETGTLWNLEATPAEGCSYRLAQCDVTKFGKKKVVYTNSTQLPVDYTSDFFEALKLQDELQCKYTGGTVLHMFLGEGNPEPSVLRDLTRKIFSKYKLPYISWVPKYSICKNCGRLSGHHNVCPKCSDRAEVITRVVGYFRPVSSFNIGKQNEFKRRRYFEWKERF